MPALQERQVAADLRARWSAAFARRDVGALAGLYTDDALFFGSRPELFRGREGVATYFRGLAADVILEAFEAPDIVAITPEVFVTAGYWRFTFAGETRFYRLTWVVVARAGRWLIAQHHAAPLEGLQAAAPPPTT